MTDHHKTDGWTAPLHIAHPDTGQDVTVCDTEQAKDILDHAWPTYHGSQYARAERACGEALAGHCQPDEARRAFIAAAVEAHLQVHA